MFMSLIFTINLLFLNFNNPLMMGILMLMQTLNIIMIMGKIHYSFWFSLIIFLVFVGGLFILFVYMISLTYNNKMFSLNYKNLMMMFMIMITILFINKNLSMYMNEESNKIIVNKENLMNLLKFFNFPNNFMNIFMVLYLLILMIIVVKITNFFKGPLKMKNL